MKIITIIILLILIIPIVGNTERIDNKEKVDCSFLYIIANKAVKMSIKNPKEALKIIKPLLNTTLPPELMERHKTFYNYLEMYVLSLINYEFNSTGKWDIVKNLTKVYNNLLASYRKYSYTLFRCVRDPQVAASMSVSTRLQIIRVIMPNIENIINSLFNDLSINDKIKIIPSRENYRPGDKAEFLVLNSNILNNITIALVKWPTLEVIKLLNYTLEDDGSLLASSSIPYAWDFKELGLVTIFTPREVVRLAVIVSGIDGNGVRRIAFRPFNVTYDVARFYIDAPQSVLPGQNITFSIVADGYYSNVSLGLNKIIFMNTSLFPGINNFTVNPTDYNVTGPIIVIHVIVWPGATYLGNELTKPVLVALNATPFRLESPGIVYSWTGRVSIKVESNITNTSARVSFGPLSLYNGVIQGSTLSFFASLLPITPVKISLSGYVNGYEMKNVRSITVINPTYIAVLALILTSISAYPEALERLLVLPVRIPQPYRRAVARVLGGPSFLYRRVKSKIAEIYYKSLVLLKQELPRPNETLREHYRRLRLPDRVKRPLWRLLRLAERDLYGRVKPRYREAEKALKEVLRSARKEEE